MCRSNYYFGSLLLSFLKAHQKVRLLLHIWSNEPVYSRTSISSEGAESYEGGGGGLKPFLVWPSPSCLRPSTNVCTCVYTCVHSWVIIALCWPNWVCKSCGHLLLSVWGHCDPLLQSCGPAWVQKLGDPVGHWTNSGALPHWFRPPQTLPIAGEPGQPDDEISALFPTQSSSGKLATRHSAGPHTGNEPKENIEYRERHSLLFCSTMKYPQSNYSRNFHIRTLYNIALIIQA